MLVNKCMAAVTGAQRLRGVGPGRGARSRRRPSCPGASNKAKLSQHLLAEKCRAHVEQRRSSDLISAFHVRGSADVVTATPGHQQHGGRCADAASGTNRPVDRGTSNTAHHRYPLTLLAAMQGTSASVSNACWPLLLLLPCLTIFLSDSTGGHHVLSGRGGGRAGVRQHARGASDQTTLRNICPSYHMSLTKSQAQTACIAPAHVATCALLTRDCLMCQAISSSTAADELDAAPISTAEPPQVSRTS